MVIKHDLSDIKEVIQKAMDNPLMRMVRSNSANLLRFFSPILGTMGKIGNGLLSEYSEFKLSCLLMGLASGLNVETRMNELYLYVNTSQSNAIHVADLLSKTIYSGSPMICVIYGLVLARHINPPTELTYEEMIMCKALENATDYDLRNFKEIADNYLVRKTNGRRVELPDGFAKMDAYKSTCDWCVYNRIFVSKMADREDMPDQELDLTLHYYEEKPAVVLLDNINDARQVWDYCHG